MVISKFNFPIYGIVILISLIIGMIFNIIYLKTEKIENRKIFLFIFMASIYSIGGGALFNSIVNGNWSIGLSSYGGALGMIISSVIFEKMSPSNNIFKKVSILSLPLIYSISKLACFFAGCCYGLPYSGVFNVRYTSGLNIQLFPVQLLETIIFFIVFWICFYFRKSKNSIEITIILSAFSKFILDFLRYDHIKKLITLNQVISLIFIVIAVICIILKNKKID